MGIKSRLSALFLLGTMALPQVRAFAFSPEERSRRDVRASYCEIFIDKAIYYRDERNGSHVALWIRTNNGRLDSYLSGVGFFGIARLAAGHCAVDDNSEQCDGVNVWRDYPMRSFSDLPDYFTIDFTLNRDFVSAKAFEGAFYVETIAGTRYWANTDSYGNFNIDTNVAGWLEKAMNGRKATASDIDLAVPTADSFYYFNPNRCR